MAGQAMPSAMQLSTFTKVTSIPGEKSYSDFPVAVRVKAAPEMTFHEHTPVNIVAVIDVSGTMSWNYVSGGTVPNHRLELVKEAMNKVIQNLGGAQNRLAVVPFSDKVIESAVTPLTEMTKEGQQRVEKTVDGLKAGGGTAFKMPLTKAAEILDGREAAKKNRLAFIIFLSDGDDPYFTEQDIPRAYPIHAFGVSEDHGASAMQTMANVTSGSYTSITTKDLDKITEKLDQLSDKLSSIVAVDISIHLKSLNPGVSLLRIESSAADDTDDSSKSQISDDKQSADIFVGAVSSGKEEEFTAYLYVPEGQGNGAKGAMELLTVGGSYKQSWDQKQMALGESVVTVERPGSTPPAPSSCKELDWIEERVEYWCKVKLDLSAMYDKAEAEAGVKVTGGGSKCQCQDLQALREASLEAVNKAMHHDIYTATLLAIKLRHCGCSGTAAAATENAPLKPAKAA